MNIYVAFLSFFICFLFNYSNSACMEDCYSPSSSPRHGGLNSRLRGTEPKVRQSLFKQLEEMEIGDDSLSRSSSFGSLNEEIFVAFPSAPPRKGCSFDCSMMSAREDQLPSPEDVPMENAPVEVVPMRIVEIYVKRAGDPLEGNSKMVIIEESFAQRAHRVYRKKGGLKREERVHLLPFNKINRPGSASPKNQHSTRANLSKTSFTP